MKAVIGIVLCISVGSVVADTQCPDGDSPFDPHRNKYPIVDNECYSEDLNHRSAYPGDCQRYIYCNPTECEWRQGDCDADHYWNNIDGRCVHAENADCGGALFANGSVVQIENVEYQKVLHCRNCDITRTRDWTRTKLVIGLKRKVNPEWNQVLVAKRRFNNEYYSLAFNLGDGEQVKVITDLGDGKVGAKMYDTARARHTEWRFVPIPGRKSKIHIISVASGLALTMGRRVGDPEFSVRVSQPNPEDRRQQWVVNDLNGNPLAFD